MLGHSARPSDFSPKGPKPMTAAVEARTLISRIAGLQPLGHSIKAALRDVARKTGIGDRRVRALWNREARSILSDEMDRLREVSALEEARNELRQLNGALNRAEAVLHPSSDGRGEMDHAAGEADRSAHRSMAAGG